MALAFFRFTRWFIYIVFWAWAAILTFAVVVFYRAGDIPWVVGLIGIPSSWWGAYRYTRRDRSEPEPEMSRKMVVRLAILWSVILASVALTIFVIHTSKS